MTNDLFNANKKLVYFVLEKISSKQPREFLSQHYDDLEQEGMIALWIASEKFDESKGVTFSTYAVPAIARKMVLYIDSVTHFRRKGEKPTIVSLEEETAEGLTLGDLLAAPEKEDVTWILENEALTERERKIVRLKYEGYTQKDIARVMECEQATISRKLRKIGEKLNKER